MTHPSLYHGLPHMPGMRPMPMHPPHGMPQYEPGEAEEDTHS